MKIKRLFFMLLLLSACLAAPAQVKSYYKLVESNADLVSGCRYLICCDDPGYSTVLVMNTYERGNNCNYSHVNKTELGIDMVPCMEEFAVLTLEACGEKWSLKSGDKYMTVTSKSGNHLEATDKKDEYCEFYISIEEDKNADVYVQGESGMYYIRCFSKAKGYFSSYKSQEYKPVRLYKYEGDFYIRKKPENASYGTVCLSFAPANVGEVGGSFYKIAGIEKADGKPESLVIEETKTVEAGKPYIFKFSSDWLKAVPQGETVTEAVETYGMVGNLTSQGMYVPVGCYLLSGDRLRLVETEKTGSVSSYRAYINLNGVAELKTTPNKAIAFPLGGAATGIGSSVRKPADMTMQRQYNTAGQKVGSNYHGIIIRNGKKTIGR